MNSSAQFLNPSEAARRLGVSVKALRLYEARGLIAPVRTAAGWRAYGPDEMARVAEIAALRELGLSLAQVARVLEGDSKSLEPALAAHQAALEGRVHQLVDAVDKVRRLRADLAGGRLPAPSELARLLRPAHRCWWTKAAAPQNMSVSSVRCFPACARMMGRSRHSPRRSHDRSFTWGTIRRAATLRRRAAFR